MGTDPPMGEIYNENLASSVLTFKTEESTAALGGMHVPHASCRPIVYASYPQIMLLPQESRRQKDS